MFRTTRKKTLLWFIGIPVLTGILAIALYQIPFIHEKLSWRIDELQTRIKYAINPPEEAIFVPEQQQQLATIVQQTLSALTPEVTDAPETPTPEPATPTPTLQPLPQSVFLEGVQYEDQHNRWNYCGPSNLSMALNFWGWDGDRDVVGAYVKPSDKDKNVLPSEMEDFVRTQTFLNMIIRQGGDIQVLKQLISAGFPVLVEKGYYEVDYTGNLGWLGHYQFVTGYDDTINSFLVQDTYIKDGKDHLTTYDEFLDGWISFNYIFLVVYPAEQEEALFEALGPWLDSAWAAQHALETAVSQTQTETELDEFFAWFNLGTSHVALQQYVDAAYAYDQAFAIYASLTLDDVSRPYRIMWYQTGPFWAYYYSGRFGDVINLANTTLLETISEPVLEECFYWRGLAYEGLGDIDQAIHDWRVALELHPDWDPARIQLERVGAYP
ncbi:MAG: tetratricopeptide repeat protein [Anaerolineales bacterium]|nr:tetratricopeptide repeat protein [Anaerolineales bacterium]